MRRGFTLIEIILVLVISAILALGAFKGMDALYLRSQKAKAVTELSLNTQTAIDQIAVLLGRRVPSSAIGYDGQSDYAPLDEADQDSFHVLEWVARDVEGLTAGRYSGFAPLSSRYIGSDWILSPDTHPEAYIAGEVLLFADAFAQGIGNFGWHGDTPSQIYEVKGIDRVDDNESNITLQTALDKNSTYEIYYLADTAYAVARGEDVDMDAACIQNLIDALGCNGSRGRDLLFLFYGYRPWKGESYCADKGGSGEGNVTILARDVTGFRAELVDGTIRLSIDAYRPIRGAKGVHVSKQKVVF